MINFQTTHLPKENEKKRVPLILHFLEVGEKEKKKKLHTVYHTRHTHYTYTSFRPQLLSIIRIPLTVIGPKGC